MIIKGKNYLSKSGYKMYKECPLKYKLKYVDGLEEKESVYHKITEFGNIIHNNIEHVNKNVVLRNGVLVFKKPYKYNEEVNIRGKDYILNEQKHMDSFLTFSNELYKKYGKKKYALPTVTEGHYFNHEHQIHGFIDAVYELPDGGVVLVDWKTGRKKTKKEMYNEMLFYALVYGRDKVKRVKMFFTKFDGSIATLNKKVDDEVLDDLMYDINLTHDSINGGFFNKSFRSCWFCPFKGVECKW